MKRLEEIEKRLQAATPGPWYIDEDEVRHDYDEYATGEGIADCSVKICAIDRLSKDLDHFKPDREFIVHSPEDIAWLIKELDWHDKALKEAKEIIKIGSLGPSIKWRAKRWLAKWDEEFKKEKK